MEFSRHKPTTSIQHFKGLVNIHNPSILFLSETLSNDQHIRRLTQFLQFNNYFNIPKIGRRGGLRLVWEDNLNIQILLQSQNYIHTEVTPLLPEQPWFFTGIYGPPHPDIKKNLWQSFPTIFSNINPSTPWLLIGDFNDVLNQSGKKMRKASNICSSSTYPHSDGSDGFYRFRIPMRPIHLDKQPNGSR